MDGRGWQRPIDGRGRGRGAGAEPPLGDGDHDQDTQPGSVANRSPRLAMLSQTLLCGVPTVDRKCDPGDVASGRAAQPQYSRGDLLCRSEARHRGGSERSVQIQHDAPSRRLERSEEHTSELQSHSDLVCRLLLEKKKKNKNKNLFFKKKKKKKNET